MKRLLWFRRDLRINDNPLLSFDGSVLPIFIFDTNILDKLENDDKRVSYIFYHVKKLKDDLENLGLNLKIFYGDSLLIIKKLQAFHRFDEVVASGDYDSYAKQRDKEVSHVLPFRYLQDSYIFKHNEVLKDDESIYYVFTPFYKKALKVLEKKNIKKVTVASLELVSEVYDSIYVLDNDKFNEKDISLETLGFKEQKVQNIDVKQKIKALKENLDSYKEQRDFLDSDVSSHLSTELRFGIMGVRELLRELIDVDNSEAFIRQLIFRDYYAYLLFHIPSLETKNFKYSFNGIENTQKYKKFCEAKTGVPLVDAGIRELLETGNMHNRVRMVVASFFTKDLLLPWQWGEEFFAKYLLDYDKSSNVLSWQWSASTGVDPQPYFRVFNPYLQSKKFDKEAHYIKKYVPELVGIESKYIHKGEYLHATDIDGYPKPMVHHKVVAKNSMKYFRPTK